LTGSSQYVDEIEKKIERQVEFRGQGRPGNQKNKSVPFFSLPQVFSRTGIIRQEDRTALQIPEACL
jgi:hypothetical protein